MTSRHHPDDELLMSFAAGALEEAHAAVIACYLQFDSRARARVRTMEAIGGCLLDTLELTADEAADQGFFERTMARFAEEIAHREPVRAPAQPEPGDAIIMPGPLARATGFRRDTIPWQRLAPGVNHCPLPVLKGNGSLRLLNIEAGASMPCHAHGEDQLMLVLWGAFRLDGARYERGSFARIEAGALHQPAADSEEGMICLSSFGGPEPFDLHDHAH